MHSHKLLPSEFGRNIQVLWSVFFYEHSEPTQFTAFFWLVGNGNGCCFRNKCWGGTIIADECKVFLIASPVLVTIIELFFMCHVHYKYVCPMNRAPFNKGALCVIMQMVPDSLSAFGVRGDIQNGVALCWRLATMCTRRAKPVDHDIILVQPSPHKQWCVPRWCQVKAVVWV